MKVVAYRIEWTTLPLSSMAIWSVENTWESAKAAYNACRDYYTEYFGNTADEESRLHFIVHIVPLLQLGSGIGRHIIEP